MADGRKNNGGARPGAGRPKKAEEEKIKNIMDSIVSQEEAFELLWERAGTDQAALALWLAYRNGKPSASLDLTTDGKELPPPIVISSQELANILLTDPDELD